jgi:polyisoprenoid-binding protein YceI
MKHLFPPICAVLVLAAPALALPALAQPAPASTDPSSVPAGHYVLDPNHTHIAARINHMGLSTVTVDFPAAGSFDYDPADIADTKLSVTTDAGALSSGFAPRDEHLKGKSFFNVEAFPKIAFTSTRVTRVDATHARVNGVLTLLGVAKPLTLDVTFIGAGKGMAGDVRAGFEAHAVLKRSDFGMTAFLPAVGDDVALTIDTETSKSN